MDNRPVRIHDVAVRKYERKQSASTDGRAARATEPSATEPRATEPRATGRLEEPAQPRATTAAARKKHLQADALVVCAKQAEQLARIDVDDRFVVLAAETKRENRREFAVGRSVLADRPAVLVHHERRDRIESRKGVHVRVIGPFHELATSEDAFFDGERIEYALAYPRVIVGADAHAFEEGGARVVKAAAVAWRKIDRVRDA